MKTHWLCGLLFLVGCADDGAGVGAPPGSQGVVDLPGSQGVAQRPQPGSETERVAGLVEPDQLGELDRLIGRYARGDAPVYRGRLQAVGNGRLDDGPVAAALVKDDRVWWLGPDYVTGHTLTFFSQAQQKRFRLSQVPEAPGRTRADMVVPYNSSFGVNARCDSCLVDLASHPETLDIDLAADGFYADQRTPLAIRASGHLERVPPADLTWSDLVEISQVYERNTAEAIAGFRPRGAELVRTVRRELREVVPRPPSVAYDQCARTTTYETEWWVDPAQLGDFGVRNLTIVKQETCCSDSTFMGCTMPPTICF